MLPKFTYDPVLARRAALISRLEEHMALAQDTTYMSTVQLWIANEQGAKSIVGVQKRVQPWWAEDGTGMIALTVRYGWKAIEFETGKAAIMLPNKGAVVSTLDTRRCSGHGGGAGRDARPLGKGAGHAEGEARDTACMGRLSPNALARARPLLPDVVESPGIA